MLGEIIRKIREEMKISQQELADFLNVSRSAVCMWEANKREMRMDVLLKIAEKLGVSLSDIIKNVEARKEEFMNKKGAKKAGTKKVSFFLEAPLASKVILTGDFTSWKEDGIAMSKKRSGRWETTLLLKPGRYEYKFIVDGQWWTDPKNPNVVTNSFGTQNSVISVD